MDLPLLWRAMVAFVACPGMVAYAVPIGWALISHWRARSPAPGTAVVLLGTTLLLTCVREFYVAGRGTLAPWSPPKRLVRTGLYRFSRNPMYVAVTLILAGCAIFFGERELVIYALVVPCAFHLRVVLAEEPFAERVFGEEWSAYRARTPRWVGIASGRSGSRLPR